MNERIKELAGEARIKFSAHWAHQGVDTAVITMLDLKEFAELIVRECCAQIENERPIFIPTEWDQGSSWGHKNSIDVIKQHFGVKE
jgi:hypothetical protein